MRFRRASALWVAAVVGPLAACAHAPRPGTPLSRRGDEIAVCGQLFHTGTPVVLWNDPGGYDAYRLESRLAAPGAVSEPPPAKARYGSERRGLPTDLRDRVRRDGWRVEDLQRVVRLLVLHYDETGTSRQCFKILHDVRGLSVHFLLDLDGTIYQTLDLKESAWHAAAANDHSIGIEIANIGAYRSPDDAALHDWYRSDAQGPRITVPERIGNPGLRRSTLVVRPARPHLIEGEVHGATYYQYDFTDEQYEALIQLTRALCAIFPRLEPRVPRDASGAVRTTALGESELAAFQGIVGHWHVAERKIDPGPAFDWDRLLEGQRAR